MLARRLRLPQLPARQCCSCCHECRRSGAVAWFSALRGDGSATGTGARGEESVGASEASEPGRDSRSSQPTLFEQLNLGAAPPQASVRSAKRSAARLRAGLRRAQAREHRDDYQAVPDWDVSASSDQLRAWLEGAAYGVSEQPKPIRRPQEVDGRAVLVLSSMPRSLVESDFYRLAPQGRHLAGWAGGINKVVQSISGATRELRGQYFLFFDNAAAAAAYKENLRNLFFEQAKHTGSHPPASDPNMVPGTKASAPTCFSLLPPDAKLSPVQLSIPQLAGAIAANQAKDKEEGFLVRGKPGAPNRSSQQPSYSTTVPYQLPLEMAPDGEPTLVERSRRVLVRLAGSKITAAAMARFIEADGAERNLPWRLIEERPGVRNWPRPLQALQAGSGPIAWGAEGASEGSRQEEGGENPPPRTRGYTRFVVTFADAAEAKRFARTWHRRELLDERTARTMVVNAHALW